MTSSNTSEQKRPYQPSFVWWLIAMILGSSSIAALVSIAWQKVQEFTARPAHYELVDFGFNERRQMVEIILQNVGGKLGVITGVRLNDVYHDEFYTDYPVGGRERQKFQFQRALAAVAPPGGLVTISVKSRTFSQKGDIRICIEQAVGAEHSEECRDFHK